ncbi:MAG: hypothetical protein H6767_06910 [Candidatus Peribacteria bacterium]|nr:MAG: hypothetical protein H6767_06910 [Candidatus Peribacteria bacterium]
MLTNKIVRLSSQRSLIIVSIALFLVASVFFTLFFVLDRYFIVFLPI